MEMEKIDAQIDQLERDRLISLIQENQVRIGKFNIRYTKGNKKNTLEHWDACFDSYDRLLRSIPKEICRVEKEVRTKFVINLPPGRKTKLLTFINREMDVLFKKVEDLYAQEYRNLNAEEKFQKRLQDIRVKCAGLLDTHMQKCEEALNGEAGLAGRLPASEICRLYDITESLLHELNLLDPLQSINMKLQEANAHPRLREAVSRVQEGIKEMARTLQDEGTGAMDTMQERKERKMQVARETLLFRDLVLNMEPLINQSLLPHESRNQEVVHKMWRRIEEFFARGRKDWESVQSRFKSVYEAALDNALQ